MHNSLRYALSRASRFPRRTFVQVDNNLKRQIVIPTIEPNLTPNALDAEVLKEIQSLDPHSIPPLNTLFTQYDANARSVLHATLAHEPSPPPSRRVSLNSEDSGVLLLTHAIGVGSEYKVTVCSGFAIKTDLDRSTNVIVSCAHTIEESSSRSGSVSFGRSDRGPQVVTAAPISNVLTSLPRSDLVVFSTNQPLLRTLPISPYPARIGTRIRAHLVCETRPTNDSGWSPWIHGTWNKWVCGELLGYRDFSGREAEPGTYDSLNHLLFSPPPSAGSSGGPIVDEETGSVIGIILGSRMDNRIEGVRGWGVPSEVIYEMFQLPGLGYLP